MTLAARGRDGLAATIRRHNDRARTQAGMVAANPGLELRAEPTLSIVCFRVRVPDESDGFNKAVMEAVQVSGRTFVTQAVLDGSFWLRATVIHPDTDENDLVVLLEAVCEIARDLKAEPAPA
jgi:aromatic-L-amino-acid decarboxylase